MPKIMTPKTFVSFQLLRWFASNPLFLAKISRLRRQSLNFGVDGGILVEEVGKDFLFITRKLPLNFHDIVTHNIKGKKG